MSVHLRYGSRDRVVDALVTLGVSCGGPIAVWPPRPLPHGLFVSPVRNGWVSIWSPRGSVRGWLRQLTATLNCAALLFEVVESELWTTELFHNGRFLGRVELPTEAVKADDLWARAVDALEAEGVEDPTADEAQFEARMEEIAASDRYREELRELAKSRPSDDALQPFLPAHASVQRAWALLAEVDNPVEDDEDSEPAEIEEHLERFASYLGIRDASWDPGADAEVLAEGEYAGEEEGLPEGWQEFVLLPMPRLRVV